MSAYTKEQLETRDTQRQHIIHEVILAGQWKDSTSVRELVALWQMPAKHVRQLCDEAWGAVMSMQRPGAEEKAERAMAELEALKDAAWAEKDLKIVLNALRTQLQVYGKLERAGAGADRSGTKKDDDYERLPPSEKRAILQAAMAELDGKERRH